MRWIALSVSLVLVAALLLPLNSCNSALPSGRGGGGGGAGAQPAENIAQGFDLGVPLTDPVLGVSVVGVRLPRAGGQQDLEIMFIGFATESDADNADGLGTPLDRTPTPTPDSNDASDVFLAAITPSVITTSSGSAPTAFSQAMLNTFREERCVNCHSFHNSGMGQHTGGGSNGTNGDCTSCHTPGATGNVVWEAPINDASNDFDFRGKPIEDLCAAAQNIPGGPESVREHLKTDDKILWAITTGAIPDNGPNGEAALPTTQVGLREWFAQVDAWVDGGFQCDTSEAVLDIKVASRVSNGVSTTNGSSGSPSIAFFPITGYVPSATSSTFAGLVCVAFESTGTNVFAGIPHSGRNVYWMTFDVFIDQNEAGAYSPGSVRLEYNSFTTQLVSRSSTNFGASANADSMRPVLSSNGTHVLFESKATNMISGFTDRNGADGTDVFLWFQGNQSVNLISRATSVAGIAGGNGASSSPAIRSTGFISITSILAFESDATDLVAGDTNGARDVFYTAHTTLAQSSVSLVRASVASGGAQAGGGTSGKPSVAVTNASPFEYRIAFESTKTNLVAGVGALPAKSVYLHDPFVGVGGTTTLVSRAGTTTLSANGASGAPALATDGRSLTFESRATNLDFLRPGDGNGVSDVFLADLTQLAINGPVRARRLSISSNGQDGNGASQGVSPAAYLRPAGVPGSNGFLIYSTQATNLGAPDGVGIVLLNVRDLFNPDATPGNALPVCPPVEVAIVPPGMPALFDATACFDPNPGDSIVSYEWLFDDGSEATGKIVTKTYTALGLYSADLTLTDEIGDETISTISVLVDTPPECSFAINGSPSIGAFLEFDGSASSDADPGDSIVSYTWDFGDGSAPEVYSFPFAYHAYGASEVFTAELTVTDESGGTSSCTQIVTVGTPTFSQVNQIFSGSCSGHVCHGEGGFSYDSIVNVASGCFDMIYIVPGDAEASYFFEKMSTSTPTCGDQMPPGGLLPADQIAAVRAWIEAGAAND